MIRCARSVLGLALVCRARARRRRGDPRGARRPDELRRPRHAGPAVARSGGDRVGDHAVHGPLRDPRRDGEAHAGRVSRRRASRSPGPCRRTGITYDFVLRNGVKFHNGDPVTADDVKFSFERYQGGAAKLLKEQGEGGARRRSAARALRPEGGVARLPHVLRHDGDRRRLGRAEEVRREGRRRGLQEGADRRRPVQVRQHESRASS